MTDSPSPDTQESAITLPSPRDDQHALEFAREELAALSARPDVQRIAALEQALAKYLAGREWGDITELRDRPSETHVHVHVARDKSDPPSSRRLPRTVELAAKAIGLVLWTLITAWLASRGG